MSDQSIGTARIDVVVDTDKMQAGVAAAQGKMAQFGAQAEAEYNRASSGVKRFVDRQNDMINKLGMSRAEQIKYNLQMRVGGELAAKLGAKVDAQVAAMEATVGATTRASHAIHEFSLNNSFARRELGRLVTDIAKGNYGRFEQTSLTLANASGLLGKVFSKTGAAAIGMAVGVGLLFKALADSENETAAFNKALLVTGNIANTTVPKMQALADAIARNGATHGEAFDAVQKAAATGRFIGDQFELVATAAARMEDATGQSVDDTVRKFEEISQDPVKALLKLNETEHFLTRAQLDRVQALVDEGRQQDAASEGAKIYAQRLNDIATAADEARPHLARMFSDAKHELSDLVEGTKNFAEFLAAAADKYKQMPWYERGSFGAIGYVKSLFGAEPVVPTSPKPVANTVNSDAEEAARRAREALAKFASPTDQLKAAEDEAKKKFLAAIYGISDPATIAKYKADMEREVEDAKKAIERAQQSGKGGSSRSSTSNADKAAAALLKAQQDEAAHVKKLMDQEAESMQRGEDAVRSYTASLQDMLATRQSELDLQVQSVGMGQREIAMRRALIAIDEDYNRKVADLQKRQQSTTDSIEKGFYQQQLDALKKYHDERVQMEVDGYAAEQLAEENGMNGMKAAIQDFLDEQHNVAEQTQQFTTNFINGFGDAFASFASGAESAKDAFGSFIDDMERQALKFVANQAVAKLIEMLKHLGDSGTGSSEDSAIASAADSFIAGIGYAQGGAFGPSGEITAFANGGVVSSPTLFKFANGTGLMGEAGPEAIVPLKRTQSGKLGIETTGGGGSRRPPVTVNQTIVVGSLVDRRTREQLAQETARRQRIATARNS